MHNPIARKLSLEYTIKRLTPIFDSCVVISYSSQNDFFKYWFQLIFNETYLQVNRFNQVLD